MVARLKNMVLMAFDRPQVFPSSPPLFPTLLVCTSLALGRSRSSLACCLCACRCCCCRLCVRRTTWRASPGGLRARRWRPAVLVATQSQHAQSHPVNFFWSTAPPPTRCRFLAIQSIMVVPRAISPRGCDPRIARGVTERPPRPGKRSLSNRHDTFEHVSSAKTELDSWAGREDGDKV